MLKITFAPYLVSIKAHLTSLLNLTAPPVFDTDLEDTNSPGLMSNPPEAQPPTPSQAMPAPIMTPGTSPVVATRASHSGNVVSVFLLLSPLPSRLPLRAPSPPPPLIRLFSRNQHRHYHRCPPALCRQNARLIPHVRCDTDPPLSYRSPPVAWLRFARWVW